MILAFNKPYGVISQFTQEVPGQRTLAEFLFPPRVYPVGRLDLDSEGLLLLSDTAAVSSQLLDPKMGHWRQYWVQVEGIPTEDAFQHLRQGVTIQGRKTRPARVSAMVAPQILERVPPIRFRMARPTSWLTLELQEGRNRQVRKMTAAVGFPTLRLIRVQIGSFPLPPDLALGTWRKLSPQECKLLINKPACPKLY